MRVDIGPYTNWIGPYQIADWLQKVGVSEDKCYEIGSALNKTKLKDICQWIHSFKERKIKVKIHDYDSWSVDSTLSVIIYPLLKQLRDTMHGSGFVDMEDVPENLRYIDHSDDMHWQQTRFDFYDEATDMIECDIHTRWKWVIDEMIWAFEQLQPDCDWEEQYWITRPQLDWSNKSEFTDEEKKVGRRLKWKVKGVCDWDGRQKHQDRINNGLRLFGKYYQSLWD